MDKQQQLEGMCMELEAATYLPSDVCACFPTADDEFPWPFLPSENCHTPSRTSNSLPSYSSENVVVTNAQKHSPCVCTRM